MQAIYALWPWKETRDLNQDAPAPEVCPGHQDVCYSDVPSALRLTARHHHLAEPKALLREGCTVNVSTRSWDFSEFMLSDEKKCFAERFPNLLLNPYLKVGWKEKERERYLLLVCPDECSLSGFGIRNGEFILLVTSTLRFYAFP